MYNESVVAVVCYALAATFTSTPLHADENAPAATPPSATEPAFATAPALGLLMNALGKAGIAEPLNTAGINIYGYVEGGYMYDLTASGIHDGPTFIGFN